jgi:hypothetical protein
MSAIASQALDTRNSLLRLIVLGTLIVGTAHTIVYHWIMSNLIDEFPLSSVYQYIASGVVGVSAFEGGTADALLGVFFHYVVALVVTGIFILSAEQIPLLRQNAIPASLVYGLGVYFVMDMIVIPLSATPDLPPYTTGRMIINYLEHALVVGLPLGILVWRNANSNQ